MADAPLYETGAESLETLTVIFETNPAFKVTGTGFLPWGLRRQVSKLQDGSFDGFIDAVLRVWLPHEGTDWNVLVKDPKSGSIVKLPRTADVIDGLIQPALHPKDVAKIGFEVAEALYPDAYPWALMKQLDLSGNAPGAPDPTSTASADASNEPVTNESRKSTARSKRSPRAARTKAASTAT